MQKTTIESGDLKGGKLTDRELLKVFEDQAEGTNYRKGLEAIELAQTMATVDSMAAQSKHNEDLRRAVNREAVPSLKEGQEGDEAVGSTLQIDCNTENHYHGETETDHKTKKKRNGLGRLGRIAIGAGLVASGAAVPGIPMIIKALREPAAPVVIPSDENTRYSLDLGE
jgi:hypothetical protein